MDSQESPPVHHPPQHHIQSLLSNHHQCQQPPPHVHGTTAPPPTPPPQPHQQAQPNSYILPNNNNNDFICAKVIFHQPQQQNLQFPFNLISGKNQKFNLDHSNRPTTTGLSIDPAKKKRGRPRKYSADGNIGLGLSPTPVSQNPSMVNPTDPGVGDINTAAFSENPSKKGCWRPPGSEEQQQQQREISGEVGFGFTPHLINVNIGEDIASRIMTFLQQTPRAVGILSATGVVRKATLQHVAGGGTMTYKGQLVITSLSGIFLLSESNGRRSRTGRLSVSLARQDGSVFGGVVAGMLTAVTPVQVDVFSFVQKGVKPNSEAPSLTQPPNFLNFGAPVTETSSPSTGASSHSADEKGGSLLNH